jgi:phosphate transport system permease protein
VTAATPSLSEDRGLAARRRKGRLARWLFLGATVIGVIVLAVLLLDVMSKGLATLNMRFLTSFASSTPAKAGVQAAIWGTLWVLIVTACISFPIGVGAAVYLEEYAADNRINRLLETNIANLAGVPSIVYGLLGLAIFVRLFGLGRSVVAGGLTLGLLVMPMVIIAAREALRAVPPSIRSGALALGATRWQTIRHQVLPLALPGIMTGTILALSRAIGETAPILIIGGVTFITYNPDGLTSKFTSLPIQIFNWISRPQAEFRALAASAILVLLAMLLTMNAVAIWVRNRHEIKL